MKVWCARCATYRDHVLSYERKTFAGEYRCENCGNTKPTPRGYTPIGGRVEVDEERIAELLAAIEHAIPAGGTIELARMVRPRDFEALDELRELLTCATGDSGAVPDPAPVSLSVQEGLMVCGHPLSAVVSADEGTKYCSRCEDEARAVQEGQGEALGASGARRSGGGARR